MFRTHLSLEESYQRLKPHLLQFNAILCANDIVAVFLLRRLKQDGYTVPEQLYLFSYSYSHLAESVTPGISGVSLDHEETGRQAVRLYSWLLRQKPCTSVSVRVRSWIIVRQSTEMQQPSIGEIVFPQPSGTTEDIYLYHDKEAIRLQDCESIMATCDETDFQLIRGLLEEKSYTRLEEELFLSSYALRYRIKRLLNLTHCESRYELIEFLKYYHSLFS